MIVNYNGVKDTLECLDSLDKAAHIGIKAVFIVIDNRSELNELSIIAKHQTAPVCIQNETNLGFVGASNQGITAALNLGVEFVLLLNNDTVVSSSFLTELLSCAKSQSIGLIGPKILYHARPDYIQSAGGKIIWDIGYIHDVGSNKQNSPKYSLPYLPDWVSGCAILVRRQVFDRISLLDGDLSFAGEDIDFAVRARAAGFKALFCPTAVVWHKVAKTRQVLSRRTKTYTRFEPRGPKLFEKYQGSLCKHLRVTRLCYLVVIRPIAALEFMFLTRDPQLRLYYCKRAILALLSFDGVTHSAF